MNPLDLSVPNYTPNEYGEILNALVSDNPPLYLEADLLKKGGTGWVKGNTIDEQQKSRLELNQRVLQFLQEGAKTGLLTQPDMLNGLRKFQGKLPRHKAFHNNSWLRSALDLSIVPFISDGPLKLSEGTNAKIAAIKLQFDQHCQANNFTQCRQTFFRSNPSYRIPIASVPTLIKKIQAVALQCLAEAALFILLKGFSLKCSTKAARLWTSNASIRSTLSKAYAMNECYDGSLEHLTVAASLNPKNVHYHKELFHKINKENPDDGLTYFHELVLRDPTNQLYIQSFNESMQVRDELQKKIALEKFAAGKDNEALEVILQQAQTTMEISFEDKEKLLLNWHNSPIQCQEPENKLFLVESELSKIFRHDNRLKKNFAFMQADSQLNKEPLLKIFTSGSLQNFTGSYFLHFLKLNSHCFKMEDFIAKFQSSLQAWEKLKFTFLDLREGEHQLNIFKKVLCNSLEKIKDLLEFEFNKNLTKQQKFFKEYIDFNAKNIANLKEGEFHFIFANWFYNSKNLGHAVIFQIIKQPDGQYSLILVNTGDGISQNHKEIIGRKLKYNPYYVIKNIPPSNLQESSQFYQKLIKIDLGLTKINNATQIYEDLLSTLGGIMDPEPLNEALRRVITPQRSGSCSWSPYLALLRLHLSPLEYKEFIFKMKAQSILQFHNLLRSNLNWDVQARKLLEIAINEYQLRLEKMHKLQGSKEVKHLLSELEWQGLEILKANL